jgi:hypothetical protein
MLALVACDPGMTIREHRTPDPSAPISFTDQTQHSLIGENWFTPHLRLQNVSDAEVVISSVELNVAGRTYLNTRGREDDYPVTIRPREAADLPVWFDLGDQSIYKLFYNKRGKVLVRYTFKGVDALIAAEVSGGAISANR